MYVTIIPTAPFLPAPLPYTDTSLAPAFAAYHAILVVSTIASLQTIDMIGIAIATCQMYDFDQAAVLLLPVSSKTWVQGAGAHASTVFENLGPGISGGNAL